ncbi:hypothetical protein GCM10027426_15830 [Microbacterium lacusdiani]
MSRITMLCLIRLVAASRRSSPRTDPHSPNEFRRKQIVCNIDAFYYALGVTRQMRAGVRGVSREKAHMISPRRSRARQWPREVTARAEVPRPSGRLPRAVPD